MNVVGNETRLSISEFGLINVKAIVTMIKATEIDTRGIDWSKQINAPVIGKFKRYVTDIRTYTFKNNIGHTLRINATPNHPFFVENKHRFVPIRSITDKDKLLSIHDHSFIRLVCPPKQHMTCGIKHHHTTAVPAYTLEVYKRHYYPISKSSLIVHNTCLEDFLEQSGLTHPPKPDDRETLLKSFVAEGTSELENQISEDLFVWRGAQETLSQAFEHGISPTGYKPGLTNNLALHYSGLENTRFLSSSLSKKIAQEYATGEDARYSLLLFRVNRPFGFSDAKRSIAYEMEISHIGKLPATEIIGGYPIIRNHDEEYISMGSFEYNPNFIEETSV